MELSSSPKERVLSSSDCMSDPEEEHEVSEEEDDDRNHKHRRKEEEEEEETRRSQSLLEQGSSRPYRKSYRSEHEKRPPPHRVDNNQRARSNPMFSRDGHHGRGRGRGGGNNSYGASWAPQRDNSSRFDLSSHMVPGMFAQSAAPWPPAFGMMNGVPNGGMDAFHHLQGSLRPPLGIPRQRCRDFEERGFCLRGDMCPMEHGINRIVVDDVQSLSQFNLPVSGPGAPHMAASSKPVPAQFGSVNFMSSKGAHGKTNESGMVVDGMGYGDAYPSAGGSDFYDPDQPLWNNNSAGETSGGLPAVSSHGIDENVAPLDDSNQDGPENAGGIRDSRSKIQPVWGRTRGYNGQANFKEKADAGLNSSGGFEDQPKEVAVNSSRHVGESVTKVVGSSNASNDAMNSIRKPMQKAMRTLFVNGVPHEINRKDLILSHFQKFGKVIDIRIPINSERAFVQFSKREEAESALRAPDAVMGNRFIKLWWANRDSIPDNGLSTGNGASTKGRLMTASGGQNQLPITAALKNNHVTSTAKGSVFHAGGAPSSSEQPKPVGVTTGPKVTPLQQKKAEDLERLKETLRKKQEMLEQKREEFRKKLARLEKQGTVVKGEEADEPDAKRVKVDTASNSGAATSSPRTESSTDKKKVPIQKPFSTTAKLSTETPSPDPKYLKQRPYPFTTSMNTPMVNRFKLDNRTTTIKVVPPLPTGLADIAVLKEHFSSYGEVSKVELEDNASTDSGNDRDETDKENRAACITFVKRSAAEKAFANAKYWKEHTLQLKWVTRQSNRENNSSNNNNLSVTGDHLGSKKNCTAPVPNDPKPKPKDEVRASSTELENNTNVSGDDKTLDERETKESDNGNSKSNSESVEGASEAVAVSEADEEQING